MADTFARRREMVGSTADWAANNLVLGDGEIAFQRDGDVVKAKLGDGLQTFAALPFFIGNLWTSVATVTYSTLGGSVVIGDEGATALDQLTVYGTIGSIGSYKTAIPNVDEEAGWYRFGAWDAADTPKTTASIRALATSQWNPANIGSYLSFVVTEDGTTTPVPAVHMREDGLEIFGERLQIRQSKTPASANDTGSAGDICWDSGFIYVCIAPDTWVRAALATWP